VYYNVYEEVCIVRTNIVIDEDLMSKAMEISKLKTKKDVVDLALNEYVTSHSRKNLIDLFGKIEFANNYDHKALREGHLVDFS